MGNLALIFTNRSWTLTVWQSLRSMNRSLWAIAIGTILALLLVLYVPLLRNLFHFSVLHPSDVLIAVLAGFFGVVWFEALKLVNGRGRIHQNPTEAHE
jgi:Ca2+-transporting ATPase